jgi:hypothetical protein
MVAQRAGTEKLDTELLIFGCGCSGADGCIASSFSLLAGLSDFSLRRLRKVGAAHGESDRLRTRVYDSSVAFGRRLGLS